ncbi:hypothetical protein IAT38_007035 [Cryptococcus sp. DSM 104549]
MGKDPYTAVQASLENLRPHLSSLHSRSSISQTRPVLKALEQVQDAVQAYAKTKKSKKRKESGGAESREAEQVKVDWLDTEGVQLWNLASQVGKVVPGSPSLSKEDLAIVAALRLTGYRLVEVATDTKGQTAFVIRLINLAAKAMSALVQAGKADGASELALQAADYEGLISSSPQPRDAAEIKQHVSAMVLFYLARIDILINEGNDSFSLALMHKAIQLDEGWSMGSQEHRLLASKCWTVGNDLLKDRNTVAASIDWLNQGLMLVEKLVNRGAQVGSLQELHVAILKSLARAQMLKAEVDPQALTSATATLNELAKITGDEDKVTMHEMRLLQLYILKTQKVPESEIRAVLEDLVDMVEWTEESVLNPTIPAAVAQKLLARTLAHQEGHPFVQLIIYEGLLFAKSLTAPHAVAAKCPDYHTEDRTNVIACQTLLWNIAAFHEAKDRVAEAANWYQLAAHDLFKVLGGVNVSRCLRKAALCYIKVLDFTAALDLIKRCPSDEASTHYLAFLAAVRRDRQQAAIDAVTAIVECPDLEGQQLVLMTSLANEKGSQPVLVAAMRALLGVLTKADISFDVQIETVTVIRCLVRLTVLEIPGAEDKDALAESLVEYLQAAIDLLTEDPSKGQGQTKGIAWLYKCAYNTAVLGLSMFSSKTLADLFDCSAQLMSVYELLEPMEVDPDLPFVRGSAMFACLCGKIFMCKEMPNGPDKVTLLGLLLDYIPQCRDALQPIDPTHPRYSIVSHMRRIIDTSEVELCCEAKDWAALPEVFERVRENSKGSEGSAATKTLEMISNVLFRYDECPSHITYQLLQHIIDSCSTNTAADITRFSRWLRAILRILLHRSSAEDEATTLRYATRAQEVIKSPTGKSSYPSDELHWLVATAWNRGLEWFSSSRVQQAKEWCEVALSISACSPGLNIERDKMQDHYQWGRFGRNGVGGT